MSTWERMRQIVKNKVRSQGIKQKFIAEQCGFDEKNFSRILNGRKTITSEDIEKFCDGMGVMPNDLFQTIKRDEQYERSANF